MRYKTRRRHQALEWQTPAERRTENMAKMKAAGSWWTLSREIGVSTNEEQCSINSPRRDSWCAEAHHMLENLQATFAVMPELPNFSWMDESL